MRIPPPALWIASHLGALALGFALAPRAGSPADGDAARLPAKASERPARPERRVPTTDLLAAYGNSEFWSAARARRNKNRPGASGATDQPYVAPDVRAAQVRDIPAALDAQLEAVNRGKSYDHMFAKALIKRWMLADRAACAQWLGAMKMRGVWQDPFNAFAGSLPAADLLGLVDDRWLPANRSAALEALAEKTGTAEPASLPGMLEPLGAGEAARFLATAARHARPEDASWWLQFAAERNPDLVETLAAQWIRGPGSSWEWRENELVPENRPGSQDDWREHARLVMAAAGGTPAEAVFQRRFEQEELNAERGRLLALAAREPVAAMEQLLALETGQGRDAEEVREELTRQVSNSFGANATNWRRSEWEQGLQSSVLGERPIDDVIIERLDLVEAGLPDLFRPQLLQQAMHDAMQVDPAAAVRVGVARGLTDRVRQAANEVLPASGTPQSVAAGIILAMEDNGLLANDGQLRERAADFTKEYLRDDPGAAETWLSRLPTALAQQLRGGTP